jgi:hypothetical protein
MSLRELCRRHGVTAHSAVMVQARQGSWAEKRRFYRDRARSTFIEHHADRAAAREAEVHDQAIEAIDEAITRFRADLRATERKLIDGEWVEVPVLTVGPRDLALLIDRLQVLFGRPAMVTQGLGFAATISSEALPIDALQRIVELTRPERPPVGALIDIGRKRQAYQLITDADATELLTKRVLEFLDRVGPMPAVG